MKLITRQERAWSAENPIEFTGALVSESHELYDLDADPGETRNLHPGRSDLFEKLETARGRLFEEMRRIYTELHRAGDADARSLPEDVKQRLRKAGYLH